MATTSPYLPYILKDVVTEVDSVFSARSEDPFHVFFDHGLYVEVDKNIYAKDNANTFPLIWLVTSSIDISRGRNSSLYGSPSFDVIIAMPTDKDYTQTQRDELVFLPRLIPIYDEFIYQLKKSNAFNPSLGQIEHRYRLRPYWGGVEGGSDPKGNLFKNFIDAIQIIGIKLEMKNGPKTCAPSLKTL